MFYKLQSLFSVGKLEGCHTSLKQRIRIFFIAAVHLSEQRCIFFFYLFYFAFQVVYVITSLKGTHAGAHANHWKTCSYHTF